MAVYWYFVWLVFPMMFLTCMAVCIIGMLRYWCGGRSMRGYCSSMFSPGNDKSNKEGGDKDEREMHVSWSDGNLHRAISDSNRR